ncbi:TetR family transcriptional regulator [Streptomyces sp. SID14478]|uniref:TetR/AcrR family transcriptional regulator n=1 Tax=Streptomyces sp. SID14478 TaxID=2706073 RepID=UPI0013DCB590|nr:TetR/AcrR family transcriptional regulator [Streptomyces sp. SID14478]NEB73710.1 TetR family transcriptional regulator [Streptomyces sp. SID14478]
MGRWEPNARERLAEAAMELFVERGYESATAAEIAQRAGLAKSTFFRHFADKREVLFGGQEVLNTLIADGIAGAPATATPIEALGAALQAASVAFGPERREWVRTRQDIVAGHSDLRERELLKRAALVEVMTRALRARGVPDPAASLVSEIGSIAFRNALERWIAPSAAQPDFAAVAREELDALKAATAALS